MHATLKKENIKLKMKPLQIKKKLKIQLKLSKICKEHAQNPRKQKRQKKQQKT